MYGLIGEKLSHSFSADFFNKKFLREGINEFYKLIPISSISEFPGLITNHLDLKGLNVTIPYKEEVIKYLDGISEAAQKIGAVNVIKFIKKDNIIKLQGYNTDWIGFEKSLNSIVTKNITNALILGTGGASKAVAYVLKNRGIKFTFVSRNPKRGDFAYTDLNEKIIQDHQLIINTTPLGMYPNIHSYPDIPYNFISKEHVCFDLVYNPEETLFLRKAKEYGATVKNGSEMLQQQALAAWEIWNR